MLCALSCLKRGLFPIMIRTLSRTAEVGNAVSVRPGTGTGSEDRFRGLIFVSQLVGQPAENGLRTSWAPQIINERLNLQAYPVEA